MFELSRYTSQILNDTLMWKISLKYRKAKNNFVSLIFVRFSSFKISNIITKRLPDLPSTDRVRLPRKKIAGKWTGTTGLAAYRGQWRRTEFDWAPRGKLKWWRQRPMKFGGSSIQKGDVGLRVWKRRCVSTSVKKDGLQLSKP